MTPADVDALLDGPAVVFGSLPPEGRDLDLLLPRADVKPVRARLVEQGWLRQGRTLVRFGGGTAFATDLVALEEWAPTAEAGRSLWDAAAPLDGFTHLRAPAPHHRLLVLAVRYGQGMQLDERKRSRVAAFSDADWDAAAAEATAWGCADALAALRSGDSPPAPPGRRGRRGRRPAPVRIVSLSGLDGSGKSTQAEHLRTALTALGYDTTVEWTKIARDPVLTRVSAPVKAVLGVVARRRPPPAPVEEPDPSGEQRNHPDGPPPPPDAATLVRQRNPLLTWAWTLVVAWANGRTHRGLARGRAGSVIICDRYVLDSLVHLRYRYGAARRFHVQGRLIRALSPRPTCAVLLDVAPATARARKPEQYTTSDLTRLRALYVEEAGRLKAHRADAEQPEHELAAEIAALAWQRLAGSRGWRRRARR